MLGYLVDNAYLRVGACLDKIAQMVRVYYEHPDHGGPLFIEHRCGNCGLYPIEEKNCSFGALSNSLHKNSRDVALDQALFDLEANAVIQDSKGIRNNIAHKLHKNIFYPGLDPDIKLETDGVIQKTTYTFGNNKQPNVEEYRKIIAEAHNAIANALNIIGPIIFPDKK